MSRPVRKQLPPDNPALRNPARQHLPLSQRPDQQKLEREVARLLQNPEYWHLDGKRAGQPIVNHIVSALSGLEHADSLESVSERNVSRRVKRAIKDIKAKGDLRQPSEMDPGVDLTQGVVSIVSD